MRPPRPPRPGAPFDAVCFGYNSCDLLCSLEAFPTADDRTPMLSFARQGGGQAATAAATLARLGFSVRYLGKFGSTPEGAFSRGSLLAAGVDVSVCPTVRGVQNQLAVVWSGRRDGTRTVAYLREPGLDIAPGEFRAADAAAGVLLMDGHHVPAAVELAHAARAAGAPVLIDAGKPTPDIGELLDAADYILCDERFAPRRTGVADQSGALAALARRHGAPFVAATLGARGSLALVDGQWIATPAFAVEVVDATGAGDVWHGAFAAGLLRGLDVEEILRFAAGAAAMKCRRLGGRAGIPTASELEAFLREARPREES